MPKSGGVNIDYGMWDVEISKCEWYSESVFLDTFTVLLK